MRRALAVFNEERAAPPAIHLGVNAGLGYAGGVGGGRYQDYSVMDDAVNMAARLMSPAAHSSSNLASLFVRFL